MYFKKSLCFFIECSLTFNTNIKAEEFSRICECAASLLWPFDYPTMIKRERLSPLYELFYSIAKNINRTKNDFFFLLIHFFSSQDSKIYEKLSSVCYFSYVF